MFTNACLCRPPGNATPPKTAVSACRVRLYEELRASGVQDVIALGGTAAEVLVDDPRKITALRVGPPKPIASGLRDSSIRRVVPTWHPAYCLRNADAFPALVTDIGKLQDARTEPWKAPRYHVIDEPELAIRWLNETTPAFCVVDIEFGFDKDEGFDHPNNYDMLCVGLGIAKSEVVVLGSDALAPDTWEALASFLQRTKIIAHNGKFDLSGLFPHIGGQTLYFDTMLAHYALDERSGTHGLKYLAVELLGAPQYDDEIRKYVPRRGNYADIPRPILYQYNAYDCGCTWDLFELFSERLVGQELTRVHDLMVAASNQLMYLELNGITMNLEHSNQLRIEYLARLADLEAGLEVSAGEGFNPRSPKQIKEFLQSLGVVTPSTDETHLKFILERSTAGSTVRGFIEGLLRYRRQQKLFSTYVDGIRRRLYRGRIHTTYLLHGTTSGRLASRNPNLQNIVRDKEIRKQFGVSSSDNVLIQADYKQAEGRVIATLAQDEYLRQVFADKKVDIFNEMSDSLYGKGKWGKEERVRTKAFFYGLSYGRQAHSIAAEYRMSAREAETLLREFMGLIPATVAWQNETKRRVLAGDDLITFFGRRRRFRLITDDNRTNVLNEALSFLPQSTASDICLSALTQLRPMLKGLGWIRLTIHDALVVECPQQNQERVSELMTNVMVEQGTRFTDYVPFVVDLSSGKSWGDL
jgi:DNA polymerase-1